MVVPLSPARRPLRQLGYTRGYAVGPSGRALGEVTVAPFPQGPADMRVWLSGVNCTADDYKLDNCAQGGSEAVTANCRAHV
jgi:hypothetical protein